MPGPLLGQPPKVWSGVVGLMLWTGMACERPCEPVAFRKVELRCDPVVGFSGEAHFDSRANFETFLRSQCLLPGEEARIADTLAEVDFRREVVFVAVRPMDTGVGACLLDRQVNDVEICEDGLNVIFDDEYFADGDTCPNGNWTIAFVLSRDDMRTALRVVDDG